MKLLQSVQTPVLLFLFIQYVMSNFILNPAWPINQNQCKGDGAECYSILSFFAHEPIPRAIVIRDCSSFLQEVITPQVYVCSSLTINIFNSAYKKCSDSTSTLTVTFTAMGSSGTPNVGSLGHGQGNPGHRHGNPHGPRNIAGINCDGPLPTYAGGCNDASRYSSACSCFGVTATAKTLDQQTHTVTEDITTIIQAEQSTQAHSFGSSIPPAPISSTTSISSPFLGSSLQSSSYYLSANPSSSTTHEVQTTTRAGISSAISLLLTPSSSSTNTDISIPQVTVTTVTVTVFGQNSSIFCDCSSSTSDVKSSLSISASIVTSVNVGSQTSVMVASNKTAASSSNILFSPHSTLGTGLSTVLGNATSLAPTAIISNSFTSSSSANLPLSTCLGELPFCSTTNIAKFYPIV